jgi:NADH-quinone oxidoreductase subunit L
MLFGDFFKDAPFSVNARMLIHRAMEELAQVPWSDAVGFACLRQLCHSGWLWLAWYGRYYMYMVNPAVPAAIKRVFMPIYTLLENKYYMDWFNENVLARGARALGTGLWKAGDQGSLKVGVVNGSWKLVAGFQGVVRVMQTGYLYHYALVMLGVFVLMTYIFRLARQVRRKIKWVC